MVVLSTALLQIKLSATVNIAVMPLQKDTCPMTLFGGMLFASPGYF